MLSPRKVRRIAPYRSTQLNTNDHDVIVRDSRPLGVRMFPFSHQREETTARPLQLVMHEQETMMSRTISNFAIGTLLLVAAAALPAQQPHPNPTPPSMGAMMQQMGAMQQRMDGVSTQMMQGGSTSMGGMSGMMGMGHSNEAMGQMATRMTQMLTAMQGYMTQMQALKRDSAVVRNPAMMKNLQDLQRNIGAMLTTMAPMIGTMQQMQQHMGVASSIRKP